MGRVRRVKVSRRKRAELGTGAGLVLVAAGVYLVLGLGWALIVVGAAILALFLTVYDVDEPERRALESTLPTNHPLKDWSEAP